MGASVLFIAAVEKARKALAKSSAHDVPWADLTWFPFVILGMGFACGVVVWLLLPLSARLGRIGDVIVGGLTGMLFFAFCILTFVPEGEDGWFMLGPGAAIGMLVGLVTGKAIRGRRE